VRSGTGRSEQCQRPQECRQNESEATQREHGTRGLSSID
jgi:hypothetical protein